MRALGVAVVVGLMLAGCMDGGGASCPAAPSFAAELLPVPDAMHGSTGPLTDALFRTTAPTTNATLAHGTLLDGNTTSPAQVELFSPTFGVVRIVGHTNVTLAAADPSTAPTCRPIPLAKVPNHANLGFPAASPGRGAHVHYAGFWENGTLFGTDIPEVDHAGWPHAGWYAYDGSAPLPVYVYGQDASEEPPQWKAPSQAYAQTTPGTPVDGAAYKAASAGDAAGLGYYTTIKGFNQGLQQALPGDTYVVHLAPKDAYTRPGLEHHPLYGAGLVFLVHVDDVVTQPCPAPATQDPRVQPLCALGA